MKRITLKACAKINLGLAVLGRRLDGYHELRTVFQTIALADRLEVRLSTRGCGVGLEATGLEIPSGRRNLAALAAEAALEELKLRATVSVLLDKRIPPGSGLGGASSDAATVLRAVLLLSGRTLPQDRLLRLAAELGSDVPFFLYGGTALGLGRGEEVYLLPDEPRRHCVVFFPGQGMDTSEAYRGLRRPTLTPLAASPTIDSVEKLDWLEKVAVFCGAVNDRGRESSAGEAASASRGSGVAYAELANDFEPLVFRRLPGLADVKETLQRAGADKASLSGSGSAVYGLFRDAAAARRAALQLRSRGKQVLLTRTVSRREFEAQWREPAAASK